MGSSYSKPEKIYRAARGNEVQALQSLLRDAGRTSGDLLEFRDPQGYTPLIAAAHRGNIACVDLLLRAGANLNALTDKPNLSSALHEAAAHNHIRVIDALLAAGANPFIENGKGLTAVDIAINQKSVAIIRKLESRAPIAGYLALKSPRYMGLSSEWKTRWCVIMPRYPTPTPNLANEQRVVRSLLVIYKGADQFQPICKAWLDGAIARSVVGSKGGNQLQCALALHRSHAPPSGAHVTGDPQNGFTLHLRPAYSNPEHVQGMRRFMELCNMGAGGLMAGGGNNSHQRNSSAPAGGQQWAPVSPAGTPTWQQQSPHHQRLPSGVPPVPQHVAAGVTPPQGSPHRPSDKAATLGPLIADPGMTDEQMARRLQQAFDHEAVQHGAQPSTMQHQGAQQMFGQPGPSGGSGGNYLGPSGGSGSNNPGPSGGSGGDYPAINHVGSGMPPGPLQASAHGHSSSDVASAYPRTPGERLQQQASAPPLPPLGPSHSPHSSPGPSRQHSTAPAQEPANPLLATTSLQSAMAWWNQLPSAGTPPASALAPPDSAFGSGSRGSSAGSSPAPTTRMDVGKPQRMASGPNSGAQSSSDDEAMCVVCLEQPACAGFVHGDSVHKCCCRNCAADLKQANYPTCPMCRQRIEHIILNFY